VIKMIEILVTEEEIEKVKYIKYREEWKDMDLERKQLYELLAYTINRLNKLDGGKSRFTGFNIWITECVEKNKKLKEFLGV